MNAKRARRTYSAVTTSYRKFFLITKCKSTAARDYLIFVEMQSNYELIQRQEAATAARGAAPATAPAAARDAAPAAARKPPVIMPSRRIPLMSLSCQSSNLYKRISAPSMAPLKLPEEKRVLDLKMGSYKDR